MLTQIPLTRDLVLIGGGHTHALVLRMWGMRPVAGVRLTVISPDPTTAYSGMLPGFVAGHYTQDQLNIDLVQLARHAGARLILGRATGIDRDTRHIRIDGRPPLAYDILSIDIGITSEMPNLTGFAEFAVPAKPLDTFAARWQTLIETGTAKHAVIIGGGVAGVEIALAAAHRLGKAAEVTVLEAAEPLQALGRRAKRALLTHMERAGIHLMTGVAIDRIENGAVQLTDGRKILSDFTIGTAGTRPQAWLGNTGLSIADGFISVDETLRSTSDTSVFATGDIAHLSHAPRPKAGVFAVRQAPILLHNLRVSATGKGRMRPFHPQRDYLKLISTGDKNAVADKWGLPLDGAWLWRWKDRIDQKFMRMFAELPVMPTPQIPREIAEGAREAMGNGQPLCGGCGAKVGQAALQAALVGLPVPVRADVLHGHGDDAAVLQHSNDFQVITTDHLRAFTDDYWLLARITAIHSMGDIWSMGAHPQSALAQIILPPMSPRLQTETLREIMAAASEAFAAAGADVVGGHTSLGSELTVGFTVTGLCASAPIGQTGAKPGDALLLTKPIGTGVILAAEMARAAPGRVVTAALTSMARSQASAAAILTPCAHAMTDVTGFGLAGHLLGMLVASRVAATLDLGQVPILQGAETLAAAGHQSTLLAANRAAMGKMFFTETPRSDLLFDPQTAGGLLAAIPRNKLPTVLEQFRKAGEFVSVIGNVGDGPAFLTVTDLQ